MKPLFILVFMLVGLFTLQAQQYQGTDYYNDASVITSISNEQLPSKSLKSQKDDFELINLTINTGKVATAVPEKMLGESNLNSGYEGSVTLGYGFKVGDLAENQFNIDIVNGYRVIPYFYVGLGIGVRFGYYFGDVLMPFYLNFKSNFLDKNVSPYISLDIGMSHEISSYGIDFYYKPSIGLHFGRKISFLISFGTEFQREMSGSDYHLFPTINAGIVF